MILELNKLNLLIQVALFSYRDDLLLFLVVHYSLLSRFILKESLHKISLLVQQRSFKQLKQPTVTDGVDRKIMTWNEVLVNL